MNIHNTEYQQSNAVARIIEYGNFYIPIFS